MRSGFALILGLLAACGGDDGYGPPPGGGGADAGPDGPPGPDAPPGAADAAGPDGPSNDLAGPAIVLKNPKTPGTLVKGTVTITVEIKDPDGLDLTSIEATITGRTLDERIEMRASGTDLWSGTYDTVPLAGKVFPVVTVKAKDRPGNENRLGFELALDNNPPISDLDPPRVREWTKEELRDVCSNSFDPVGQDALSDWEPLHRVSAQLIEVRARVMDRSNIGTTTSTVAIPLAGVDDDKVELLILDDTSQPLVVHTTTGAAGTSCDAINPKVVPKQSPRMENEAVLIHMRPLDGSGASFFQTAPDDPFTGGNAAFCGGVRNQGNRPVELCPSYDNETRIAVVPGGSSIPMIYTIPTNGDDDSQACAGFAFDALAANFDDGWACLAVRATDKLGNVSVSRPIRACIDVPQFPVNVPPNCAGTPPTCVGTFTAPDTVTSDPCTIAPADRYFDSGRVGDYELLRI